MSRRRRRLLLVAAGVPIAAIAVLGIEVELARRGANLDEVELMYRQSGATRALWLGDSTAYGLGVIDGADAVASLVAEELGEAVTNLAVSGATLADVVENQLPKAAGIRPAIVYISVGANDVTHLTGSGRFEDHYQKLLNGLPAEADVVVLGVPDMGAPPRLAQPLRAIAGHRGRQLDAVVRRVTAGRPRTVYVDIASRTGPVFRSDPGRYFAADGYHPSADGYRRWADAVLATVGP